MNRSLLSLNLGSNLIAERGAAKLAEVWENANNKLIFNIISSCHLSTNFYQLYKNDT